MIRFLAIVLCLAGSTKAEQLEYVSSLNLQSEQADFGGWSGIHVFEGGEQFLAINDAGNFMQGSLRRIEGKLAGGSLSNLEKMIGVSGRPYKAGDSDSEGLAIDSFGNIFVSFEHNHRIRMFTDTSSTARSITGAAAFKKLQDNSGLEALAVSSAGHLYTLPERSGEEDRPFPVWRAAQGKWAVYDYIPRRGRPLPVGADIGPGHERKRLLRRTRAAGDQTWHA